MKLSWSIMVFKWLPVNINFNTEIFVSLWSILTLSSEQNFFFSSTIKVWILSHLTIMLILINHINGNHLIASWPSVSNLAFRFWMLLPKGLELISSAKSWIIASSEQKILLWKQMKGVGPTTEPYKTPETTFWNSL